MDRERAFDERKASVVNVHSRIGGIDLWKFTVKFFQRCCMFENVPNKMLKNTPATHKHNTEWKKPETRECVICDFIQKETDAIH